MIEKLQIRISPKQAYSKDRYLPLVAKKFGVCIDEINHINIIKKSIDARKRPVMINLQLEVFINQEYVKEEKKIDYSDVSNAKSVIVVGAGPAGLFASLQLVSQGLKPILIERGADVSQRKRDIAKMYSDNKLNYESNYCYGEGGAGTFSDGKLYTRSKKKGNTLQVLELLVMHGADPSILYESHPHIGTNKLPGIIKNIRETIINSGGEVHFNTKMSSILIDENRVKGVVCENGKTFKSDSVILATGHSAREVYYQLHKNDVKLEPKAFAVGVRIEHKQELIDRVQYKNADGRGDFLPPAEYNIVHQVKNRGVYSFCMCPGGMIVPASTDDGETVVNGMSNAKRSSKFANSGFVVEVKKEDLEPFHKYGDLAGLEFQKHLESLCFQNSGEGMIAPAQRLVDFVNKKKSESLPDSSYLPGLISSEMHNWLPKSIGTRLSTALSFFARKIPGFLNKDSIMVGVESRTSSPVRIPRDKESLEHIAVSGLYPCGEGSGYSGGIVSSAIDGQRCAMKISK
jgi:uncharacterized FAD-dependent dehydrogenase